MQGAPPPPGWAVKYLSGMEEVATIRPGYWLEWYEDSRAAIFRFGPELLKTFNIESHAQRVVAQLRRSQIETEVVPVG